MYQHPKWKHLGLFGGRYACCVVDNLNFAIYDASKPSGWKHSNYFGDLGSALAKLLELIIREKVSQEGLDVTLLTFIETITSAKEEVLAFGRQLDKALQG
jgi:hypothetical protein